MEFQQAQDQKIFNLRWSKLYGTKQHVCNLEGPVMKGHA